MVGCPIRKSLRNQQTRRSRRLRLQHQTRASPASTRPEAWANLADTGRRRIRTDRTVRTRFLALCSCIEVLVRIGSAVRENCASEPSSAASHPSRPSRTVGRRLSTAGSVKRTAKRQPSLKSAERLFDFSGKLLKMKRRQKKTDSFACCLLG